MSEPYDNFSKYSPFLPKYSIVRGVEKVCIFLRCGILIFWSVLASAPTSASAGAKEASNSTDFFKHWSPLV